MANKELLDKLEQIDKDLAIITEVLYHSFSKNGQEANEITARHESMQDDLASLKEYAKQA